MNPSVALMSQFLNQEGQKGPSPAGNWLNPILRIVQEGYMEADIKVLKEHTNPIGTMHGGVIALVIDELTGACAWTLHNKNLHVSQNLYVDYFKPAYEGETIRVKAKCLRKGSKIINIECCLYNDKEVLLAKGVGNLINTEKPNPFSAI